MFSFSLPSPFRFFEESLTFLDFLIFAALLGGDFEETCVTTFGGAIKASFECAVEGGFFEEGDLEVTFLTAFGGATRDWRNQNN